MVISAGILSLAAAAGAGQSTGSTGGLFGGGSIGSGAIGGLLGGALGGLLGGSRGGGFNTALRRSIQAREASLNAGVSNFEKFSGRFMDQFRETSPVFGALESRVLSDLNDTERTSRLEKAFQDRIGQQQRSRGTFSSPSGALQSAFAGLQFQEQIRQQSFDNAFGFQQALGQPLATGFFQAGLPNIQADIGFQQQAFDYGATQASNQSIANGISQGFSTGFGLQQQQKLTGAIGQLLKQLGIE